MRFYQERILCSIYNRTLFRPKDTEIRRYIILIEYLRGQFRHKKCLPPFSLPPYEDFKCLIPLCSSNSHEYNNYDKPACNFSSTPSLFTCPQAKGTPQVRSPSTHQRTPFKLYLLQESNE